MRTVVFDFYGSLFDKNTGDLYPKATLVLNSLKSKCFLILLAEGDYEINELINKINLDAFFKEVYVIDKIDFEFLSILTGTFSIKSDELYFVSSNRDLTFFANEAGLKTIFLGQNNNAKYSLTQLTDVIELLK